MVVLGSCNRSEVRWNVNEPDIAELPRLLLFSSGFTFFLSAFTGLEWNSKQSQFVPKCLKSFYLRNERYSLILQADLAKDVDRFSRLGLLFPDRLRLWRVGFC